MNLKQFRKLRSKAQLARAQQKSISRQEQKEKMLAAAAHLFCSHGFDKTKLDQVAADIGLTKPRLYVHFENKKKILEACIERALRQWKTAIDEIELNQLEPSEEAIRSVVERYADVAFSDFGMCLIRSDIEYLDVKERDMLFCGKTNIDGRFKTLIAEVIPRESRPGADTEFLWLMATALVHGIALLERPVAEKRKTFLRAMGVVLAGSNI